MSHRPAYAAAIGAALALCYSIPASATGVMTCKTDQAQWKSQEDLAKALTKQGWKVRKTKEDGGCYEVYGTTPEGERVEAYFHPVTFEKLYVGRRGQVLYRKKGY